jgi:hypothetical protein
MRQALAAVTIMLSTAGCTCWDAIEQVFPPEVRPMAHRIAAKESGGVATAQNRISSAAGCFQLLRTHRDLIPGGWDQRYNAWANVVGAHRLWTGRGWSPWR